MSISRAPNQITAVVFDLGKVLVDFDYTIAARNIAARSTITAEELGLFIMQTPLLYQYETGGVTSQQFFERVCQATGFAGCLEEFSALFGDIFEPIPPMIELHQRLRKIGFSTYVFSNTNELAIRHIRRSFPFFADFDGYILSYEHGAMKPDAKLYEVVEAATGRTGGELLYVDDRPENLHTGAQRGWQVVLQESPEKTRRVIEQLGLLDREGPAPAADAAN